MMTLLNGKQLSTRLLIMYLISSLLFLTSIKLHVHANDEVVAADRLSPIHISSVTSIIDTKVNNDEISISPLGVLKAKQNDITVLAVLLLAILVTLYALFECIAYLHEIKTRSPRRPFFGVPSLRAPPLFNA